MKITDKSFAVKVAGHLFTGQDIIKISIDGTDFEMEFGWCSNGEATVKCKTKDVEFLNIAKDPKVEVEETRHWNICDGEFVSKKVNCQLENIKEALSEAIEDLKTERNCDAELKIDGVSFAKMVKKYNQQPELRLKPEEERFFESITNSIDNKLRGAVKQAVRDAAKDAMRSGG